MVTMQEALARDMLEADLGREVGALCKSLRITSYHHRHSKGTTPGWPDEVLLGPGVGVLFRELKREKGKVTAAQAECLANLTALGLDADVWRPSDLLSGRIVRELGAISPLTYRGSDG